MVFSSPRCLARTKYDRTIDKDAVKVVDYKDGVTRQESKRTVPVEGFGPFIYCLGYYNGTAVILECGAGSFVCEINHSCQPNARVVETFAFGKPVLLLLAVEVIFEGKEITINY